MYPDEIRLRQDRLNNLIKEMSSCIYDKDDDKIPRTIDQMKMIYKDDFRHNYSDFFPVILEIHEKDTEYNVEYLSNNLKELQAFVETKFSEGTEPYQDLYSRFIKLFDHLSLQINEINYFMMTRKRFDDETIKVITEIEKVRIVERKLDEANKKAASIQTDVITIISIFAAIVLAVSGGISVLGNAIQSAAETETTKLILIILLCGIVLFNAIFFLMYMVAQITGKVLFTRRCMPCVFFYNLFMIILVVIDGICMHCKF